MLLVLPFLATTAMAAFGDVPNPQLEVSFRLAPGPQYSRHIMNYAQCVKMKDLGLGGEFDLKTSVISVSKSSLDIEHC